MLGWYVESPLLVNSISTDKKLEILPNENKNNMYIGLPENYVAVFGTDTETTLTYSVNPDTPHGKIKAVDGETLSTQFSETVYAHGDANGAIAVPDEGYHVSLWAVSTHPETQLGDDSETGDINTFAPRLEMGEKVDED